jgi:hypothetical protein
LDPGVEDEIARGRLGFGAKERVKAGFLPGISLDLFRLRKEMVEIGERARRERGAGPGINREGEKQCGGLRFCFSLLVGVGPLPAYLTLSFLPVAWFWCLFLAYFD